MARKCGGCTSLTSAPDTSRSAGRRDSAHTRYAPLLKGLSSDLAAFSFLPTLRYESYDSFESSMRVDAIRVRVRSQKLTTTFRRSIVSFEGVWGEAEGCRADSPPARHPGRSTLNFHFHFHCHWAMRISFTLGVGGAILQISSTPTYIGR